MQGRKYIVNVDNNKKKKKKIDFMWELRVKIYWTTKKKKGKKDSRDKK